MMKLLTLACLLLAGVTPLAAQSAARFEDYKIAVYKGKVLSTGRDLRLVDRFSAAVLTIKAGSSLMGNSSHCAGIFPKIP
jgi:hypothetical protein